MWRVQIQPQREMKKDREREGGREGVSEGERGSVCALTYLGSSVWRDRDKSILKEQCGLWSEVVSGFDTVWQGTSL